MSISCPGLEEEPEQMHFGERAPRGTRGRGSDSGAGQAGDGQCPGVESATGFRPDPVFDAFLVLFIQCYILSTYDSAWHTVGVQ